MAKAFDTIELKGKEIIIWKYWREFLNDNSFVFCFYLSQKILMFEIKH